MLLADYLYYTDTYKGNYIAEHNFDRLMTRAGFYLDSLCDMQLCKSTDAVKMAACAVAEAWQINEQGGVVVAQTVGKWSKTYQGAKSKSNERRLFDAAALYLGDYIGIAGWC